ncbi:hypothetical protein FA13DRAFT_1463512 [Coprinellus micaceus]|uniref:Uncharacterized protein n=1 Tax=Coprinellus micaceus TaxID=71717 RepID=A0A4Y7SLW0_COPMI|nr:hypothetical protein FA13DRAFT_1463512 [Coprinellus micaceus]
MSPTPRWPADLCSLEARNVLASALGHCFSSATAVLSISAWYQGQGGSVPRKENPDPVSGNRQLPKPSIVTWNAKHAERVSSSILFLCALANPALYKRVP